MQELDKEIDQLVSTADEQAVSLPKLGITTTGVLVCILTVEFLRGTPAAKSKGSVVRCFRRGPPFFNCCGHSRSASAVDSGADSTAQSDAGSDNDDPIHIPSYPLDNHDEVDDILDDDKLDLHDDDDGDLERTHTKHSKVQGVSEGRRGVRAPPGTEKKLCFCSV